MAIYLLAKPGVLDLATALDSVRGSKRDLIGANLIMQDHCEEGLSCRPHKSSTSEQRWVDGLERRL